MTDTDPLGPLADLADPVRRRLYSFVAATPGSVSRDEAAAAADIKRPLAAYHLDRLARDGLLDVHYERAPGRTGPGAGRPAKRYTRATREFEVSVPPRQYRTAARLLALAMAESQSAEVVAALHRAARRLGAELTDQVTQAARRLRGTTRQRRALLEVLAEHGYEPYDDAGTIRMRNCPFHELAREHTELVCGMNLAIMEGMAPDLEPALDPQPGQCCVAFRA